MSVIALSTIKKHLAQHGLLANSVVAISGPSSYTYLILLIALWQSRIIALTLNPKLPQAERERVLQQASATLLIADEPSDSIPTLNWLDLPQADQKGIHSLNFDWDFEVNQAMNLILTSGSSGQPKLALHSAGNYF
jgi:O-succinylbenzoic acid--CoA ligase